MKQADGIACRAQSAYFVVVFCCFFIAAAVAAAKSASNSLLVLNGYTMGTVYRVLLHTSSLASPESRQLVETAINNRLHSLDKDIFSTHEPTSELSVLNRTPVGKALQISADLAHVIEFARVVHDKSAGAFDVSIKPLVDLWGFGGADTTREIPSQAMLEQALAQIDMSAVQVAGKGEHYSVTRHREVTIDLSALAKGYAVDQLALLLESLGQENYLVEVGGEVVSKGLSPDGSYWRIGIERPVQNQQQLFQQITGSSAKVAIASSGSYQNYFLIDGLRYSHAIDPATGWPVTHNLVSVTVVDSSAMAADAWATAFLILGTEEGMELANALQLPVFFIVDDKTGFSGLPSDAFKRYR